MCREHYQDPDPAPEGAWGWTKRRWADAPQGRPTEEELEEARRQREITRNHLYGPFGVGCPELPRSDELVEVLRSRR